MKPQVYQLLSIPIISALIGYFTNVMAIKLLFWPQQPIKLGIFELYGLLPKRKAELARSIGQVVEEQLLSLDDLFDRIDTPEMREHLTAHLLAVLKDRLRQTLPRVIPDRIYRLIEDNLEKIVRQEAGNFIRTAVKEGRDYVSEQITVSKIVEDKVNDFDLNELENMIRRVSSTELRFIEVLGGVLGLIIGFFQVAILLLFPL